MRPAARCLMLAIVLASLAAPSLAANSGLQGIDWLKITPNGVMLALKNFELSDVDAGACIDPGAPYFYLPSTEGNFEERVATLLTALSGGHRISIAYWSCGANPGVSPMVQLGHITIRP